MFFIFYYIYCMLNGCCSMVAVVCVCDDVQWLLLCGWCVFVAVVWDVVVWVVVSWLPLCGMSLCGMS